MSGSALAIGVRRLRGLAAGQRAREEGDEQLLSAFVSRRDESSFAALVRRHGPMVHRVCRVIVRDHHAAQDASQATFLVLARKAGSLRVEKSLGPWLHGVACRVAAKARAAEARRQAGDDASPAALQAAARAVLDEQGYATRADGTFANCPFHALVAEHTDLVCGMNLAIIEGMLGGLPRLPLAAVLDPAEGRCCVRLAAGA